MEKLSTAVQNYENGALEGGKYRRKEIVGIFTKPYQAVEVFAADG